MRFGIGVGMVQRGLSKGLIRTWRLLNGFGHRLMRERYIASGHMVYHGMKFSCQADGILNHTYRHVFLASVLATTT